MVRAFTVIVLSALLSACWASETRLFGSADWARPPGLEGRFIIENAEGEEDGTLVLVPRKDGMIDGTATRKDEPAPKTSPVGFVAIPGGSGKYFLMVQQVAADKGGELYLIGRWQDDRLEGYWPECKGTPDIPGMRRDKTEFIPEPVCAFATKAAVLRAALIAERELSSDRIFPPKKLGRLRRDDSADKAEPAAESEQPGD